MNVITLLTPKVQVAYLYEDFTIRQGLEKFRQGGYSAIPVLARNGTYVGSVSEGDFLWSVWDQKGTNLRQPIKSILRPDFHPAVSVRVTMEELLEQAMRQSFIPVVDDRGAFMGIVTRQTIIRRLTIPNTDTAAGRSSAVG